MTVPPLEWFRRRLHASRIAAELDHEVRFHLEMRIAEYERGGVPHAEAVRRARHRFGNTRAVLAACHAVYRLPNPYPRPGTRMESIWQDLKYAVRTLSRQPAFTFLAIVTLAIGIGANAMIFSAVQHTLLRPLPFPGADRFAWILHQNPRGTMRISSTPEAIAAWREDGTTFDIMAAHGQQTFIEDVDGEPQQITAAATSTEMMQLLALRPQLGRLFLPDDTIPGNDRIVLLSESFWRGRYGGAEDVVGRTMTLDEEPYTIVGVLPAIADAFFRGQAFPIWVPSASEGWGIVRMREGVTVEALRADLARVLENHFPGSESIPYVWPVAIRRPLDGVATDLRMGLWVLMGSVGFVLLVACVNVTNMVLARGVGRSHELAVRSAIGGSRGRIVRQLFIEHFFLTMAGAAIGIGLAAAGLQALGPSLPSGLETLRLTRVDAGVLLAVVAVAVITGVAIGLVPSRLVRRLDIATLTNQNARAGGAPGTMARQVLVAVEVALAMILFIGAGLMVQSLVRLQRVDHGFDPTNLVSFRIDLPQGRYDGEDTHRAFFDDLTRRLEQLPMVRGAALGMVGEFSGYSEFGVVTEDNPVDDPPVRRVRFNVVSPGYFRTIGMPILAGRDFREDELGAESGVVIVSEAFARAHWPEPDIVGKRFRSPRSDQWNTVVGVVANAHLDGLNADPDEPQLYYPPGRFPLRGHQPVAVRAVGDPAHVVPLLKGQIWSLDPDLPLIDLSIVTSVLDEAIARPRFNAMLLTGFAGIALLLAVVGVYGVISLALEHRVHELGVRLALGARAHNVVALMFTFGLRPVLAGCAFGVVGAIALTRYLEALLFEVRPTEPAVYAVVVSIMVATGVVACALPARRITRIDPADTLRTR